jgi:hypothetical protein
VHEPRVHVRQGGRSLRLRNDHLALTDADVGACIQMGRRLVNDGLTAPAFRNELGHSGARLIDTGRREPGPASGLFGPPGRAEQSVA